MPATITSSVIFICILFKLYHWGWPAGASPRLLEKSRQQGYRSRSDSGVLFVHSTRWNTHSRHLYCRWVRVSRGRRSSAHSAAHSTGHPAVSGRHSAGTETAAVPGYFPAKYLPAEFLQAAISSTIPLLNQRIWEITIMY